VRVLAVAQAFKETLTIAEVSDALFSGIAAAGATPVLLRGSDGGDGLLEALGSRCQRRTSHSVVGPLDKQVEVSVGWLGPTAVVESSQVCGLALVPPSRRDPLRTSTRGVGELLGDLEREGAAEIYVGLGGSATMDGGVGMARAWGWVPLDRQQSPLPEGGGSLRDLDSFRAGSSPRAQVTGLADVRNVLNGPGGARVYAEQKGASEETAQWLSQGLDRLVQVSKRPELARLEGAGAAGGLGFGILWFAGGRLVRGAPWVLERVGFYGLLSQIDLLICTEGAFDATSLTGKLTGTVLEAARTRRIPAALVTPRASDLPADVLVETGGGHWSAKELASHTRAVVARALRSAGEV
jgi:glycerate kinase